MTDDIEEKKEIASDRSQIDQIIREYVSLINARDFHGLRSSPHFAPTIDSNLEYRHAIDDNLQSHVDAFEEHCKIPEFSLRRIKLLDLTITIHDEKERSRSALPKGMVIERQASVFLNGWMIDGDLEIPGVTLIKLRKVDGAWQATYVSALRGSETGANVSASG